MTPQRSVFIIPAILGCSAVLFGALGAHALKSICSTEQLQAFETAVRYQMYHSIALLVLALLKPSSPITLTKGLWLWGTVLFSGSIYSLLFLKMVFQIKAITLLALLTPLGGLLMILGWLNLIRCKLERI